MTTICKGWMKRISEIAQAIHCLNKIIVGLLQQRKDITKKVGTFYNRICHKGELIEAWDDSVIGFTKEGALK